MKNIAITGASGYLGSITIATLANKYSDKVNIIALDIRNVDKKLNNVIYKQANVCSFSDMDNVFSEHKIDTVVHLAAIIPGKKSDPKKEYAVDVQGTENVLKACVKNNVTRIIVSSSGAAYGYYADNPSWIKETDQIRGNDTFPYSRHKRLVEEMLEKYRKEHPQLEQTIFRIGTILGKNVKNQLAALFERKSIIAIKGFDSKFVFIWDQDVCNCLIHAIFSPTTGIFNVAGDGALSIREIAKILKKKVRDMSPKFLRMVLKIGKKIKLSPYGPEQMMFLQYRPVLDNKKLKESFGYIPQKTSKEVFLHYIKEKKL